MKPNKCFSSSQKKIVGLKNRNDSDNNLLGQHESLNWFKKRHGQTAQIQYLKTKEEIVQDQEIEEVFQKIDFNQSGKIDMKELHFMFLSNGIQMTMQEIQ